MIQNGRTHGIDYKKKRDLDFRKPHYYMSLGLVNFSHHKAII